MNILKNLLKRLLPIKRLVEQSDRLIRYVDRVIQEKYGARPYYSAPPWAPEKDLIWLETSMNVQSLQFMIDCLSTIQQLIRDWPTERPTRVLDVGAGSGCGANLLATLYAGQFLGHQMEVDAIELVNDLERYAKRKFPAINYFVRDVLTINPRENSWDLVICSHTIEHIEDTIGFVAHLQKLAKRCVLFYAPWKEKNLIAGHVITIDENFLKEVKAEKVKIIESPAWKKPLEEEVSRCVLFVVQGTGRQ